MGRMGKARGGVGGSTLAFWNGRGVMFGFLYTCYGVRLKCYGVLCLHCDCHMRACRGDGTCHLLLCVHLIQDCWTAAILHYIQNYPMLCSSRRDTSSCCLPAASHSSLSTRAVDRVSASLPPASSTIFHTEGASRSLPRFCRHSTCLIISSNVLESLCRR